LGHWDENTCIFTLMTQTLIKKLYWTGPDGGWWALVDVLGHICAPVAIA